MISTSPERSAETRVPSDLTGVKITSSTLPSILSHQFLFTVSSIFTSACQVFRMYGPVPFALRAAKVSSFALKSCDFSTLFFSDHALFMIRASMICRNSTGFGPLRISSTVKSSIFLTSLMPCVADVRLDGAAVARL